MSTNSMLKELRCTGCNKLLAKLKENNIEFKCPRCKKINNDIKKLFEALEAQKQKVSRDEKVNPH